VALKKLMAKDIVPGNEAWLFYGPTGGGKTYIAGTFPRPIAVLSSTREKGHITLKGHPDAEIYVIDVMQDLDEALALVYNEHRRFRTLVFDGMTSFVEMCYGETRVRNISPKTPRGYVRQEDYGDWGVMFIDLLTAMRRYPWEVVWTANLGMSEDKVTGEIKSGPASFRWLAERLPPKFDNVIYMEGRTDSRGVPTFCAYPSGLGHIYGRLRGTTPVAEVQFPTWRKLRDLMNNPLFAAPVAPPAPPPSAPAKTN